MENLSDRELEVPSLGPCTQRVPVPKYVVFSVLAPAMRSISYACATLFLSFVFHELKSTTIEYLFLVLLASNISLGTLLMGLDTWLARILNTLNAAGEPL